MGTASDEPEKQPRNLMPPGRKLAHELLRRVAKAKNAAIAKAIGKDESTVSRIVSEETGIKLSDLDAFLRAVGMKCVDASQVCVDREVYKSWRTLAVTAITEPEKLRWDYE
jgi:hypothetical protein